MCEKMMKTMKRKRNNDGVKKTIIMKKNRMKIIMKIMKMKMKDMKKIMIMMKKEK
jgi:hypothetical protein